MQIQPSTCDRVPEERDGRMACMLYNAEELRYCIRCGHSPVSLGCTGCGRPCSAAVEALTFVSSPPTAGFRAGMDGDGAGAAAGATSSHSIASSAGLASLAGGWALGDGVAADSFAASCAASSPPEPIC